MKVVVFTRSTPDTEAQVTVGDDGKVRWGGKPIINPWDEYAVEEAILQAEAMGGGSTVIAIGDELHDEALKRSKAMGIHEAIRIDIDGTDSLIYATTAATAVQELGEVQLVLFGRESIDISTDQHIYQTARKLGWVMLAYVSRIVSVDYAAGTIQVEQMVEQGKQVISAKLPAVVSVLKDINEPRYPSLMGLRKASRGGVPVWSADELGVDLPAAHTAVISYETPPERSGDVEMIEGGSVEEKAAKLVDKLIEEQVL